MNNIVKAQYIELSNPEFKGNPLIECLPQKKEHDKFFELILNQKARSRKEALLHEKETRIEFLTTFRLTFFVPQERLYQLYTSIYSSITAGYHLRNPLKINARKELNQSYHDLLYTFVENENASSLSSCLFGVSGIGKTTAVNKILSLFPKALVHNIEGIDPIVQVPIIKIECPKDSSTKDLCRSFFYQLDEILGTDYQLIYDRPKATADSMVNAMSKLAISHRIGMLIIDEIQQLANAKKNGAELLLNFFVNLNNRVRIPILIVGTPESLKLFSSSHRLPRRWSGEGAKKWHNLSMDSEWEFFIEMLFNYQYTNEKVAYSKRWAELFYYHSQGIIDTAIRIFTESQKAALEENLTAISEEIINNVVQESFWLEMPSTKALRSGKISQISQFPDLFFRDDLQEKSSSEKIHKMKIDAAVDSLIEFGIPKHFLTESVKQLTEKFPHFSAEKISLEIIHKYKNEIVLEETQKETPQRKTLNQFSTLDLRNCDPTKSNFHDALSELGVLADLEMEGILLPFHGS
ncbi:MAG: ATP-binding protein [Reichenbachiella sp.]|uniref:ATP-binding protein n=1 Tax=Reichenbachiella sp. TaxID=2184521 RepID=UPI0029668B49|nr:ATP-binding protein [Reichenbachiella sp.]MDW3212181.1 ATP-binding protein [Reichenbachiella sp.]